MPGKRTTNGQDRCMFCGRPDSEVPYLLRGISGYICPDCIRLASEYIEEIEGEKKASSKADSPMGKAPKPQEIKAYLDQYVIGQDDAKKFLSVAVYNHYKRLSQPDDNDGVEIEKSNIIMVGSTGTGKTLLARTIARQLNVPFTIVDATVFTEAGYVGEDVESILTRLLQVADYDVAAAQRGIVFIDEIDKICQEGNDRGVVSRQGVQRDLLPLIEGSAVNTKYGTIKTDHILFIASGAFQMSKPSDLIPELQGRLPIRVQLDPLSVEDFERILKEPHNSLTKQYQLLLQTENVKVEFEESAIKRIAEDAFRVNEKTENIGARRLHTIMEKILEEISFSAPDKSGATVIIDNK